MPLNVTPAHTTPEGQPVKAATYSPERTSPSFAGNTAPIPGMEAPQAPAPQEGTQDAPSEEGAQSDPDIAWRLGVVAKKDRAARERLEAAKAAEGRARSREEALAAREAKLAAEEERRQIWRQNPAALLRDHGYNAEAALQFMLNGEKLTPEQQLAASLDNRLAERDRQTQQQLEELRREQEQRLAEQQAELARREQQELSQSEQIAVQELQADIGDIVAGDPKAFPLVRKAGPRGVSAVQNRLKEMSDQQYEQTGRRPPITTKMLERAAVEVEQAARKELQEAMLDPDLAAAIGMSPQRVPARPQTLTNRMPTSSQPPAQQETRAEKEARVKQQIAAMLAGRRG